MKINVQALYTTFMGEQNQYGIGVPSIFLRLGGCHLRCYLPTKGILCDTPEALEKDSGEDMPLPVLKMKLQDMAREAGGIFVVCLTGGDPLWRHKEQLHALFGMLEDCGFHTIVETSGTIDWRPYTIYDASFVLDYKLPSTGVSDKLNLVNRYYKELSHHDYIKFVIDDETDYDFFLHVFKQITETNASIVVGPSWESTVFNPVNLFKRLEEDKLLGRVNINMQTHKMAVTSDNTREIPKLI